MKGPVLAYLSVFALVACTPPSTPPAVGAASGLTADQLRSRISREYNHCL